MSRALALLAALLLAGCASRPAREAPPAPAPAPAPATPSGGGLYAPHIADGAPEVPPDLAHVVEPEPRVEPRSRYGNRSPYTVLGRSYHVMDRADGYRERGVASWYGTKFHGRATSSMEPYDMYAFTAAHKTLPLPSYARVTRVDNGRSVVVRVNDRGPFLHGRLIDLSYAAAARLDMLASGTAEVEVEALSGPGDEVGPVVAGPVLATAPDAASGRDGPVFVQLGSFSEKDNAERLAERIERELDRKVRLERAEVQGRRVWRVRVGPFDELPEAGAVLEQVRRLGLAAARILGD